MVGALLFPALLLAAAPAAQDVDQDVDQNVETGPRKVAVLVYDGAELLDFAGPAEVLSHAGLMERIDGRPALEVFTVAPVDRPVRTQNGVSIAPDRTLAACRRADILVVPGGANDALMRDAASMDELRRLAADAEICFSVCTGAYVLGALGLLDDRRVTTHWGAIEGLGRRYPRAEVVAGQRFVDSGAVITCAGVSAGIDGALHLVERLFGEELARHTARYMEYPWREHDAPAEDAHAGHHVDAGLSRAERLFLGALEGLHEGGPARAVHWLRGAFEAGLDRPSRVLADPRLAAVRRDEAARRELARLLSEHATESRVTMVAPDEPGEPLRLEGEVVAAEDGRALGGAHVYLFHTDDGGEYVRGESAGGGSGNPRLFAHLRTDADGRFAVDTILPGSYPGTRAARHVHYRVTAAGHAELQSECLFEGDPHLTDSVRREALALGWPIVAAERAEDGGLEGRLVIELAPGATGTAGASVPAPAAPGDERDVIYIALFRPSANFPAENPLEHPSFPTHAAYMEMLHAEGIVSRGGAFADLSGALLEFLWDDPVEIDRVLQEEPFVLEDVWTYEIHAWVQSL